MTEAARHVVVDHADGLHERVADGRTDEPEAARLEVLAHGPGLRRLGGDIGERPPAVLDRPTLDEPPQVRIESSQFPSDLQAGPGVGYGRLHLGPVPHDARVPKEPLDLAGPEPGDPFRIEAR